MKLTEIAFEGAQPPIDGYAPGGFRIAGRFIEGAVILTPGGVARWDVAQWSALTPEALAPLVAQAGQVDVVLMGAGAEIQVLPAALSQPFDAAGLGVEAMSTPSACRTYNVLLSEARRVAVAALPV